MNRHIQKEACSPPPLKSRQSQSNSFVVLVGFGPEARLSYTGKDGVWRIDFNRNGVAVHRLFQLTTVPALDANDYLFSAGE